MTTPRGRSQARERLHVDRTAWPLAPTCDDRRSVGSDDLLEGKQGLTTRRGRIRCIADSRRPRSRCGVRECRLFAFLLSLADFFGSLANTLDEIAHKRLIPIDPLLVVQQVHIDALSLLKWLGQVRNIMERERLNEVC